jgi:hypothetical protein
LFRLLFTRKGCYIKLTFNWDTMTLIFRAQINNLPYTSASPPHILVTLHGLELKLICKMHFSYFTNSDLDDSLFNTKLIDFLLIQSINQHKLDEDTWLKTKILQHDSFSIFNKWPWPLNPKIKYFLPYHQYFSCKKIWSWSNNVGKPLVFFLSQ